MPITKTAFIRQLAQEHQRSQAHYAQALDDLLSGIQAELAKGHTVTFLGFGTFYTHEQPQAKITHIRTGKTITVPAHQRVGFRVGERLRRAVLDPHQHTHRKRGRFKFLR